MSEKILRSYTKIWDYERKIYAIFDWQLPMPVNPRELGYFGAICLIMKLLSTVVPPIAAIPFLIRYAMIPYGVTQFLLKKKLDGKRPIPYLRDWVLFLFRRGDRVERFQRISYPDGKKKIRINGYTSYR